MKLSEVRSLLERDREYKQDLRQVSNDLFLDWGNIFDQEFYLKARKQDPNAYDSETSFEVTTANTSIDISTMDRGGLEGLSCGVFWANGDGTISDKLLARTRRGSSDQGYYVSGTTVHFTGKFEHKVFIVFFPKHTPLTDAAALDDDLLVPDGHTAYVLNAFRIIFTIWDETGGNAALVFDNRFVNAMDSLMESLRPDPLNELDDPDSNW